MSRDGCRRRIDDATIRPDACELTTGDTVTTPSEPTNDPRPGKGATPKRGGSSGPATPDDIGYPLLLTNDEAGLSGFAATLLPGDRVFVRDLPFERLDGICAGEVVLIPPPGSDLPVRRARPTGSFAHRVSNDAPTVTAIVTLASPVADVRIPEHLTNEKHFEDLLNRHDGDLHAGLVAEGMRTSLLAADQVLARPPQKIVCTPPQITVGYQLRWSLCSWLGIFC